MNDESVKNMPKTRRNPVCINGNLWLFLTIRKFLSNIKYETPFTPAWVLHPKGTLK